MWDGREARESAGMKPPCGRPHGTDGGRRQAAHDGPIESFASIWMNNITLRITYGLPPPTAHPVRPAARGPSLPVLRTRTATPFPRHRYAVPHPGAVHPFCKARSYSHPLSHSDAMQGG